MPSYLLLLSIPHVLTHKTRKPARVAERRHARWSNEKSIKAKISSGVAASLDRHNSFCLPWSLLIIMSKTSSMVVDTKKSAASSPPSHKNGKKRRNKKPFVVPPNVCVPSILGKRNSGRWTAEEHLLFLYAIRVLGTGTRGIWKKIGLFIPTRYHFYD